MTIQRCPEGGQETKEDNKNKEPKKKPEETPETYKKPSTKTARSECTSLGDDSPPLNKGTPPPPGRDH